jgi:selenocysteine lyase/cysteine desulfurase
VDIRLDDFGGVDAAGVSAHKAYGMKGVGALFVRKGREDWISHGLSGGGAVVTIDEDTEVLPPSPQRFEIGTQNLEGFVEWSFVLEQIERLGLPAVERHERGVGRYLLGEMGKLADRGDIELYGPRVLEDRLALFTYNIGSWRLRNHTAVARELSDVYGVANRNGCFCAPLCLADLMGVPKEETAAAVWGAGPDPYARMPGAVRCSVGLYTGVLDAFAQVSAIRGIARRRAGT